MSEADNRYVSSRGLLKSCDIHSETPHSSITSVVNTYFKLIENEGKLPSIYICSSAIPHFLETHLPSIDYRFAFNIAVLDCNDYGA